MPNERRRQLALLLALPAMLGARTSSAQSPAPAGAEKLDRARFDALLAQPDSLLIVDVRRPDELVSIGGFPAYLSVQAADVEKYLAFIPRDRTIVTVSNHANRALKVASLLSSRGFRVAGAIGVQDYQEAGGSIQKIAPPPPKPDGAGAH